MTNKLKSVFRSLPQRLTSDTRGFTLVLVALVLSALMGLTGLGVETGFWYAIKRQNQSAADVAALSGAFELLAGQSSELTAAATYPDICGLAKRDAARNNFTFNSFSCPTTTPACTSPSTGKMCANNPPVLGTSAGNNNAVEVILSQQQNTFFANLFLPNVTIETRAVAAIKKLDTSCILALAKTGTGITITGNYSLTMPNCSIAADSKSPTAIDSVGNGCITAFTVESVGGYSFTGNSVSPCQSSGYDLTSGPYFFGPNIADPYVGTLNHTFLITGIPTKSCSAPTITTTTYTYPATGNCIIASPSNSIVGNYTINLSAGTTGTEITGGLSFIGNGTINLTPGTYWIADGSLRLTGNITLECTNCSPGGAGVTIIFTTTKGSAGTIGTLLPTGNVTITLSAPSSGTYAGLLIVQDTVAGATYTSGGTVGNAGSTLSGLLYFPSSDLAFVGNIQTTSNCLVAIASQFSFTGNIGLNSSGCPAIGLTNLPTLNTVALVE